MEESNLALGHPSLFSSKFCWHDSGINTNSHRSIHIKNHQMQKYADILTKKKKKKVNHGMFLYLSIENN